MACLPKAAARKRGLRSRRAFPTLRRCSAASNWPHPHHESCSYRCVDRRLCRSLATVDGQVMCSTTARGAVTHCITHRRPRRYWQPARLLRPYSCGLCLPRVELGQKESRAPPSPRFSRPMGSSMTESGSWVRSRRGARIACQYWSPVPGR